MINVHILLKETTMGNNYKISIYEGNLVYVVKNLIL